MPSSFLRAIVAVWRPWVDRYSILFEDEDILIANKLAPLPVQPEKSGDPSLQDLLRDELAGRGTAAHFMEAAHRIDRRASGALLFAKTPKSLSTLEAAFRAHKVDKEYIACVEREPLPPEGRLEHRLVWDRRRNVVRALPLETATDPKAGQDSKRSGAKGKEDAELALLEYRLAGRSERYFFVAVDLLTGKHHQIRAQFSAAGFPIRGDLKYGARRSCPNGLIMLHARRLSLAHPRTGERVEVVAPFPATESLWAAFRSARDQ